MTPEEINPTYTGSSVALIGVPYDGGASFLRGSALAPVHIRQAFRSDATNMSTENGLDLAQTLGWHDEGDILISPTQRGQAVLDAIANRVEGLLNRNIRIISLGGDHSITFPIIQAFAKKYSRLNILQLDAHPDLYDELEGNRLSHACPFARIMESGLAARLVQLGIRANTPHQKQQALRFGVETISMTDWNPEGILEFDGPLYLSLDMDVLDPAFAPGISHHEPGGMTSREVLRIIQSLPNTLVGADIVEYNPLRDIHGVTAMVAAKFLKEILAGMLV